MIGQLDDTIVALSTPAGPGERAVVRLSGANALRVALRAFSTDTTPSADDRRVHYGSIGITGLVPRLDASLWVFPAKRSYTGELLVEIHLVSSPPLVERLISDLLEVGARPARAGEFTQRAFLSGKLDLTRAEAVLAVIEANDETELQQALAQLAGGISRPLERLRSDLLDMLADVEAGLDFADEDLQFVEREDLLIRLAAALAQVSLVQKQIRERSQSGRPFRVVLAGQPNAGKSRLFNALTGQTALVSEVPGTTRDYLAHSFQIEDQLIELTDTAGWQSAGNAIEDQAQSLGRKQMERADLVIECVPVDEATPASEGFLIRTKSDLRPNEPAGRHSRVSANSGEGLDELRRLLAVRSRSRRTPPLAPSLSRCENHVGRCLDHLRKAHQVVLFGDPPEVLAVELRGALEQLGEMVGAVYTDDLLDRIFSRFCIGK